MSGANVIQPIECDWKILTSGQQLSAPDAALGAAIESWVGTPWMAGQCMRGVGVDCVRFVDAVLCQVRGVTIEPAQRFPQNMPLADREGAMAAAHIMLRRHPNRKRIDGEPIEPGDVLICRRGAMDSPGHVLIAGVDARTAWHAVAGAGVCMTSIAAHHQHVLWSVRPTDRASWRIHP